MQLFCPFYIWGSRGDARYRHFHPPFPSTREVPVNALHSFRLPGRYITMYIQNFFWLKTTILNLHVAVQPRHFNIEPFSRPPFSSFLLHWCPFISIHLFSNRDYWDFLSSALFTLRRRVGPRWCGRMTTMWKKADSISALRLFSPPLPDYTASFPALLFPPAEGFISLLLTFSNI